MYVDLETAINQIDDLEQYIRKHNLEIHGIPEQTGEILAEQVITLRKEFNVTIPGDDINICHRLSTGRNRRSKPRPIIVRFKSYRAKKELYMELAKISRINEILTRMRRELFAKVWRRKKSEKWHSAWTIDGKIFMKTSLTDQPVRIYSQEDLDRF